MVGARSVYVCLGGGGLLLLALIYPKQQAVVGEMLSDSHMVTWTKKGNVVRAGSIWREGDVWRAVCPIRQTGI